MTAFQAFNAFCWYNMDEWYTEEVAEQIVNWMLNLLVAFSLYFLYFEFQ